MLGVYELPVSSSCQLLLDDMEELMSSIKAKLEMRRRSRAAKQDRIAITWKLVTLITLANWCWGSGSFKNIKIVFLIITKVETTSRLVLIQAPDEKQSFFAWNCGCSIEIPNLKKVIWWYDWIYNKKPAHKETCKLCRHMQQLFQKCELCGNIPLKRSPPHTTC